MFLELLQLPFIDKLWVWNKMISYSLMKITLLSSLFKYFIIIKRIINKNKLIYIYIYMWIGWSLQWIPIGFREWAGLCNKWVNYAILTLFEIINEISKCVIEDNIYIYIYIYIKIR